MIFEEVYRKGVIFVNFSLKDNQSKNTKTQNNPFNK